MHIILTPEDQYILNIALTVLLGAFILLVGCVFMALYECFFKKHPRDEHEDFPGC
jgi:hypothetical protein